MSGTGSRSGICSRRPDLFSVFGRYGIPFRLGESGITVETRTEGQFTLYERVAPSGRVERRLGLSGGTITINPVEPVNLPQEVTNTIEFHFTPIAIGPLSDVTVFLTFPVEIGVFSGSEGSYTLIDVFSLAKPKYSLYGTPEKGVITRHVETGVSHEPPPVDPLQEGILALAIRNTGKDWVWVSRAVFESPSLRIFYGPHAAMSAEMMVYSRILGETWVTRTPPREGMEEAIRIFPTKKSLVPEKPSYLMEYGVGD
ncbi:MAG TPA: DUF432 domain-containing protein [Methanolinea sp.]|nr:DUF432 domain-containing protein [Methanolinea sp.]